MTKKRFAKDGSVWYGKVNLWSGTKPNRTAWKETAAPPGCETPERFAKRHGSDRHAARALMLLPDDPLPHVYDAGTGRYYIKSKEGDEWLKERKSKKATGTYALRLALGNRIRAMEKMAEQFRLGHYPESHAKCLEMIAAFRKESEYDELLRLATEETPSSETETS